MSEMHKALRGGGALLAAALLASAPAQAAEWFDGRVKTNILFATGFQSIEADNGAFNPANSDTSAGFNRQRFNLELTVHFADWITGFVDLAEEQNDFGETFQISNDLSFVDFSLLKAFDSPAADDHSLVVRTGEMVSTTFNYRGYSDGAAVQGNPLIGNSPFDMVTAETGAQLIGEHRLPGLPVESVGWDFAATVPTFGENFDGDRPFNFFAKGRVDVGYGLKLGGGFMWADGSDQFDSVQSGGVADFGDLGTTGALFGDGENYNFPGSGAGARDTHQGLIPGVDYSVWMVDAEYSPQMSPLPAVFRGWFGVAEDDFRFVDGAGNQTVASQNQGVARGDAEVRGWGLEGSVYVVPERFYVAGRYTQVSNESNGISGSPDLDRIQIGGGFWVHPSSLVKFEYVSQDEEEGSAGQIGEDWDGFNVEVSVKF